MGENPNSIFSEWTRKAVRFVGGFVWRESLSVLTVDQVERINEGLVVVREGRAKRRGVVVVLKRVGCEVGKRLSPGGFVWNVESARKRVTCWNWSRISFMGWYDQKVSVDWIWSVFRSESRAGGELVKDRDCGDIQ